MRCRALPREDILSIVSGDRLNQRRRSPVHMQFKASKLILMIATAEIFLAGLIVSSITPYQSVIGIEVFGLGSASYSALVLTASLFSVALSILVGILSDQTGNLRQLLLATFLISMVGQLLIFLFRTPLAFVLANLLAIPAMRANFSQLFAALRISVHDKPKFVGDQITSIARALFALSFAAGPFLLSFAIAQQMPLIWVYLVASVISFVCFAVTFLFWPKQGGGHSAQPDLCFLASFREILDRAVLVRLGVMGMLLGAQRLYMILFGLLIIHSVHGSASDVGRFSGLLALLEVPFMMFVGVALRWISKTIALAAGSLVFSLFLFALGKADSMNVVYLLTIPGAFGHAVLLSVSISYLQDQIAGRPGASSSLITAGSLIGELFSSALFAIGSAFLGYPGIATLGALFGLASAGALIWVDRRRAFSAPMELAG